MISLIGVRKQLWDAAGMGLVECVLEVRWPDRGTHQEFLSIIREELMRDGFAVGFAEVETLRYDKIPALHVSWREAR